MLARGKSVARLVTLTPVQAERERNLARERSVARRATGTLKQTEGEHSLDRKKLLLGELL